MRWRRSLGRTLLGGALCALSAAGAAAEREPGGEAVLRRAELVRNPFVGTAVDVGLSVVSRDSGRTLRQARYVLITQRGERALMLLAAEEGTDPGALLFADDTYRLLLPHAAEPVELAMRHVVAGELSHVGFLRIDLRTRYRPREMVADALDGVPCWRLELEPKARGAPFGRVRYRVARESLLPLRIDFHDAAGELLKTARFTAYRDTGLGPRPAQIEIEDAHRPRERAILTLGNPRPVATAKLVFDVSALVALRLAARRLAAEGEAAPSGERLVAALTSAAASRSAP
ncbi:MAG TPA: outer membrane lipoprotein-sorting protein [Thermoanaerobaculia bacterium]